jgi:hypothetical protein
MDQETFSIVTGVIFAAVALFHLVRILWAGQSTSGTGRYRCGSAGLALSLPVASLFSGSDSQRTRHATMSGRANNRSECESRAGSARFRAAVRMRA